MNTNQKVGVKAKSSIFLGFFTQALLNAIITGYFMYFGTDVLALPAMALSNILLISKLFDGATDIGMGFVIDKTKSKQGKARPWILRSIVPFAMFCVLLFAAPQSLSNGMKLVWLFVTYNLYALAYTALGISMNTLNIRLTKNEKEVNSLSTIIIAGSVGGTIVINFIAVNVLTALSGGSQFTQGGFIKLTVILGIASVLGGLSTYFTTKEVQDDPALEQGQAKVGTFDGLKSLFTNKYWVIQLCNSLFIYFALTARLSAMIYYAQYVLGNAGLIPILVVAENLPVLLVMPVALQLCNKFGKKKVSVIGLIGAILCYGFMILNLHNFSLFIVGTIVKGLCMSPIQAIGNAFIVDSVEYGEWKTGVRAEGMAFSAISFSQKVSQGLSNVVIGWILTFTGYVANAAQQTTSATNGIIFLYVGITLICTIGQLVIFLIYDLDKKMPQIRKELAEKKTEN